MMSLYLSRYDQCQQVVIHEAFIQDRENDREKIGIMGDRAVAPIDSNNVSPPFVAGADGVELIKIIGVLFIACVVFAFLAPTLEAAAPMVVTVICYLFCIAAIIIVALGALHLISRICDSI